MQALYHSHWLLHSQVLTRVRTWALCSLLLAFILNQSLSPACFHLLQKATVSGTSLVVQWLRLCAPRAGGLGWIPVWGTGSHMLQQRPCAAKKKKKPHSLSHSFPTHHSHLDCCNSLLTGLSRLSHPILCHSNAAFSQPSRCLKWSPGHKILQWPPII